jgi:hypothetical protein
MLVHTKNIEILCFSSSNIRALNKKCEILKCWYYLFEEFVKYVATLASGGIICVSIFMKIDSDKLLGKNTHQTPRNTERARSHTPNVLLQCKESMLIKDG